MLRMNRRLAVDVMWLVLMLFCLAVNIHTESYILAAWTVLLIVVFTLHVVQSIREARRLK